MNTASFIVLGVVAVCVALALYAMHRRKRKKPSGCSCCALKGICHRGRDNTNLAPEV